MLIKILSKVLLMHASVFCSFGQNIFIVNTFDKLDFEWNKIIIRHMNISEVIIFCNLLS